MVAVRIEGLDKRFGETTVLRQVELRIEDGAFAVLVGPSGCGKSTLLRLIAGLEEPTGGRIWFGDKDVTKLPPRERDIAMVFQTYALYPHLSVRDNLAFGLRLRKTAEREIKERIDEVSGMLGLDKLLERMPRELSGGQRQRVAMGRAIARRPALFLFDEPLSNLDAALRAQVRVDIRQLHDQLGTTSIYVTHDQVEAMTLADTMFVLNGGRVEQSGPPLTVYDKPDTRFVAGFLGSPATNFLKGKLHIEGERAAVLLTHGDNADSTNGKSSDGGSRNGNPERLAVTPRQGLQDGGAVVIGIRPHDMVQADDGPLRLTLSLVEELGGETYAYGKVLGQPVVARLKESLPEARPGGELRMTCAPEHIHLFDPDSGAALR